MNGQPAWAATIGRVAFDVADRLAIINLLGAYAHFYDLNELGNFRALFTKSPKLGLGGPTALRSHRASTR